MSLKDAVSAINAKIQAAAGSASAEELAYLATAVERIGGKVSVFEIDEMATSLKEGMFTGFETAKQTAIAELNTNNVAGMAAVTLAVNTGIAAIASDRLSAINKVALDKADATSSIATGKNAATLAIATERTNSLAALASASAQATAALVGQPGRLMFYSTF